ncbi:hypothetical protein CSUNSWCD_1604 [Campylobacter showae CSUNSWCD]|uniref:Uncharacterized protein n=1 Tax=Campylobacter showae CSUNSWCD TaxID=1244083 RepID=M5IR32_9BACT|nr:hypothetical protein CSUNSWCD_1604 [Campylobacter showae CSUNSWCD]
MQIKPLNNCMTTSLNVALVLNLAKFGSNLTILQLRLLARSVR